MHSICLWNVSPPLTQYYLSFKQCKLLLLFFLSGCILWLEWILVQSVGQQNFRNGFWITVVDFVFANRQLGLIQFVVTVQLKNMYFFEELFSWYEQLNNRANSLVCQRADPQIIEFYSYSNIFLGLYKIEVTITRLFYFGYWWVIFCIDFIKGYDL